MARIKALRTLEEYSQESRRREDREIVWKTGIVQYCIESLRERERRERNMSAEESMRMLSFLNVMLVDDVWREEDIEELVEVSNAIEKECTAHIEAISMEEKNGLITNEKKEETRKWSQFHDLAHLVSFRSCMKQKGIQAASYEDSVKQLEKLKMETEEEKKKVEEEKKRIAEERRKLEEEKKNAEVVDKRQPE